MKKKIVRKLGWVRDLPDFRDRVLDLKKPRKIPESIDLSSQFPPVYDQGTLGSCVGQAVVAAFDYQRHSQGQPFMSPSSLFVYYNARALEGTISSDSGTTIRSGIKSTVKLGVCPEAEWPYVESEFSARAPVKAYRTALDNQVLEYRRLLSDLNISIYALTQNVPFVFGFSVYESFFTPVVEKTGIVPEPQEGEGLLGGHAVVCCGFSNKTKKFLCRNSWGTAWGIKGYFWMPYDYLANRGLSDDFWSVRKVESPSNSLTMRSTTTQSISKF